MFNIKLQYDLVELKDLCRSSLELEGNITVDNVAEMLKLTDLHPVYLADLMEMTIFFFKK